MNAAVQLDEPVQVLLTVDDFILLSEAGAFDEYAHTELIDGVIVAVNSQWVPHARAKSELALNLGIACRALEGDLGVLVEGSARLGKRNLPMPDIAICTGRSRERAPIAVETLRLVVEISDSTLANDLGVKATIYARAGIPEYWVVDLQGEMIHRMTRPVDEIYTRSDRLKMGEVIVALTISGLEVATDNLT